MRHTFYEFFAGGGMARAGLGEGWQCVFANDFDRKKAASYAVNWGGEHLRIADVGSLTAADLPPGPAVDLAWASFPCQDLSLAGSGAGLQGARSGSFWAFWKLMLALADEQRAPRTIVLENVCGALTSHGGRDFAAIGAALAKAGYRFGAVVIDAACFVPQSRPRMFLIATRGGAADVVHSQFRLDGPRADWHSANVVAAWRKLGPAARRAWVWWNLPGPETLERPPTLTALLEGEPGGVRWHSASETRRLLSLMNPVNRRKVSAAQASGVFSAGTVYRRTRNGEQRAEVRFDGVAGCLRTPAGGSSRQILLVVEGRRVRSRLLSARETARLMGLPESYRLPSNYNEAYHLTGDGVAAPVVRFLAVSLIEPLLAGTPSAVEAA